VCTCIRTRFRTLIRTLIRNNIRTRIGMRMGTYGEIPPVVGGTIVDVVRIEA
jgi:hypothetical protein